MRLLLKSLLVTASFLLVDGIVCAQNNQNDLEQLVKKNLATSEAFLKTQIDSAFIFGLQAKQLSYALNADFLSAKVDVNLGDVYMAKGILEVALDYYLSAKNQLDELVGKSPKNGEIAFLQANVQLKIGNLYLRLEDFTKSLNSYMKSLALLEKNKSSLEPSVVADKKLKIFNNIAAVYLKKAEFSTAKIYLENALAENKVVKSKAIESTLLNNLGLCHMEQKALDKADQFFQKSLNIRQQEQDVYGQAQVLNNIGKVHALKKEFNRAQDYYLKALAICRTTSNKESMLITLESLASVNESLGNYKQAFIYFREFKLLNDRIFNSDSRTAISTLEERNKRNEEKKVYELQLERVQANQLKSQVKIVAISATLIVLLVLSILVILILRGRVRNSRLEQEKLKLQSENLELSHKQLEENLDYKDRELTANALFMVKTNELLSKTTETLLKSKSSVKKENQQAIQDLIHELRLAQNKNVWDEFEAHFTKVHSNFYENLQERFPNLTSNEKKLCAFLRLNMSTKDISAITQQSVNSITVARSRLRKKLNIEGEDVHLVNFLMEI